MKKTTAKNPIYPATKIGIISDTHGLLRPEAVAALRGVELILHAGDVGGHADEEGGSEILRALEDVAPVVAVRGNVDTEAWGMRLAESEIVEVDSTGGTKARLTTETRSYTEAARRNLGESKNAPREAEPTLIYMLHNLRELELDPAAARIRMVVSGHTHEAVKTEKGGVIYLNPGSAGPKRFRLPVTVARVDLRARPWRIEFVELENSKP